MPRHGQLCLLTAALCGAVVGCARGEEPSLSGRPGPAARGLVTPTDGMVVTSDTTFAPGTYKLPSGISIGASDITLDMNGAELVGTDFDNYGVTCIGHTGVTIRNGVVRGYYYGMRVQEADGIRIENNDLSNNYVDPRSLNPGAPFLNINIGPALGDRTNLGGGLFVRDTSGATISGNTMRNGENGIDLYSVTESAIENNNCSDNTGWGIHLNASTDNLIAGNTADRCTRPGLGDSAGVLVVNASNGNQFLNNSFQFGGDGFFIGNEHGCPSNNNLVQGNNGSSAGANAFEATFSAGNQFIGNIADGSNYGFWLGYSHSGNVIRGNSIRGNNTNGIEIEHGQNNTIEDNEITGNGGKGIVLRTDGAVHFPPAQFPCLNLPDQAASSFYVIRGNRIHSNFGKGIELTNTTNSVITNNVIGGPFGPTCTSNGANNTWSVEPTPGKNIVGGPTLGGNWWSDYTGTDEDGDGLGDTNVPYTNGGLIAAPGDPHPLIGNPDLGSFENPGTVCDRSWIDLGRNTRTTATTFNTSNGTHFATDGGELYLLEGSNSTRLDRFDPATSLYEPKAAAPEGVQDGGDFQYGGGLYFATVGVQFNTSTGAGNGSRMYAYDPVDDTWSAQAATVIGGHAVCNEALAYDPVNLRLYATIVKVKTPANGGDQTLLRKLAIYNPATDTWEGVTSAGPVALAPATEAEYLNGKIYVWRGGFNGGAVNGSDSLLYVYNIASDSWSMTPSFQASGVIPGVRSGAFDVWGVALSADEAGWRMFMIGGEGNKQVYVFDAMRQTWATAASAPYDGGWGDGLEYVAASNRLYVIDGRNSTGSPQGTAVLVRGGADMTCDFAVGPEDLEAFVQALVDPAGYEAAHPACDVSRADMNCDGREDGRDIAAYAAAAIEG